MHVWLVGRYWRPIGHARQRPRLFVRIFNPVPYHQARPGAPLSYLQGRYKALVLLAFWAVPAYAEIIGQARVLDGDTIEIANTRIRLWGIDAPEGRQTCQDERGPYLCGDEATEALKSLLGPSPVACEAKDRDRYGRTVARCFVNGQDIGAWMVRQGHALAFRRYSLEYVEDEKAAEAAKAGMWRGQFQAPWDYRLSNGR